jgi:predicted nucleic acid-binding protein
VIVLDASAGVDWLLQTPPGKQIEKRIYSRSQSLHAPHLFDLEVAQVLRRLVHEKTVSTQRAYEALQDLMSLRVNRYPHVLLLPRIWQLRNNLSAYDAAYVATAEMLRAPLITRDSRIGSAPGHSAKVELF